MAGHIRIPNDELYRTCDYDHPYSWSKQEAPPFLQLSCSVARQYRLDWGHGKRHLQGGSDDLHQVLAQNALVILVSCKNIKHVSLNGSYNTYSCLDTV